MRFLTSWKIKKIINKTKASNTLVKLHIGSGRNYKEGWINIDINPKTRKDLCIDVNRSLPFQNDSVDFIFYEHFIEHLSYGDGFDFLKESYRILKHGGVIRTAFPDIDKLIDSYINDYWRQMEWVKLINAQWYPSGCFMLNECIKEKGLHKYMYSIKELTRRLIEAGFKENRIHQCQAGHSDYKELQDAEKRADSGIVEAVK